MKKSAKQEAQGFSSHNRTGALLVPERTKEMVECASAGSPGQEGSAAGVHAEREHYMSEGAAIGSIPKPLQGNPSPVLMDKLGERLAFERTGVRLYEAMLHKAATARDEAQIGPSVDDLEEIKREELEHFEMLQAAILELGGDPTALTPSANVAAVTSIGILQVVTDPRTTVLQSLQAMLVAELTDNDAWEMLRDAAVALGLDELGQKCEHALRDEERHLEKVRRWVAAMTLADHDV